MSLHIFSVCPGDLLLFLFRATALLRTWFNGALMVSSAFMNCSTLTMNSWREDGVLRASSGMKDSRGHTPPRRAAKTIYFLLLDRPRSAFPY